MLEDQELAAIWRACNDDDFGWIVRLLTLTACRRDEIGGLRWSEINIPGATLTLPAERVKNKHKHDLPLMPAALAVIGEVHVLAGREHLFGDRSDRGFTRWSQSKRELDDRLGADVAEWRLHDIRRKVATGMGNLGVEPHIIEIVLNHHKRDIAKVYNLSTYGVQVRDAMKLWTDRVQAIIGGNIVAFPKKASETA